MKGFYFSSHNGELFLDGKLINTVTTRTYEKNDELRKFARNMANSPSYSGFIYEFARESPLEKLNQGSIKSVEYNGQEIQLPDISKLKKDAFVVYDDVHLLPDEVEQILRLKAGFSNRSIDYDMPSNLLTMILPSFNFDFSIPNNPDALDQANMKIFTYTNLNFRHFKNHLDDDVQENMNSMIRLNLLALCYEAGRQKKPLPFIVNPPGAFIRHLAPHQKQEVAQIILNAASGIWRDKHLQKITQGRISEWILLNHTFWPTDSIMPQKAHLVRADVCHIAEELWKKCGVLCPVPMMGEPLGAIGNAALGNHANKALDEFLFRVCGGIHGLVGSLRYNHDLSIFPLSRIIKEMGEPLPF